MTLSQARRRAAVVIAIFRTAPHGVVFVERAAHLREHPGQIGLPGGGVHPEDPDLAATALRELHEEVGIEPARATILGQLPTVHQRINNYDVTPFVAVVEPGNLTIDGNETAGVFVVPLSRIVDEGLHEGSVEYGGFRIRTLLLDHEGYRIWGLTARILHSFIEQWRQGDLRERVRPYFVT